MAVTVNCWYIKEDFAGFCQQISEKKMFQRKNFVTPGRFWPLRGGGESVKKEKFTTKIFFSDNAE